MNQLLAMKVFVRVVETNSFSRAADTLLMPRSTVSKLLNDLEEYLDTKLIHRTTRALSITTEGMEYYSRSLKIISEIEALDSSLIHKELKPSGHIRIDVPAAFAERVLIPLIPKFQKKYPDITVALGISDYTINVVGEGIDCALRIGEIHDLSLVARKVYELEYITCASKSYLDLHGVPSSPKELLEKHRLIGYFSATTNKPETLKFKKNNEYLELEKCHYSANGGNGIVEMTVAGLGVSQPIYAFARPWIDLDQLVPILCDWSRPTVPVYLVYPKNRHKSMRLAVFIEWLLDEFENK